MDPALDYRARTTQTLLQNRASAASVRAVQRLTVLLDPDGEVHRASQSAIWARTRGRWRAIDGDKDWSLRALTAAELARANEPAARAQFTSGPACPNTDEEIRASRPAGADADELCYWHETHELLLDDRGTELTQRFTAHWCERGEGDEREVTWLDGMDLIRPRGEYTDTIVASGTRLILDPTASLSLATHLARYLGGLDPATLRLGRRRIGPAGLSIVRDPRVDRVYGELDAEGVRRRFQPFVYHGVIVGTPADRERAAHVGMPRSPGCLVDRGPEMMVDVDCLTVAPGDGTTGFDELVAATADGCVIRGPLTSGAAGVLSARAQAITSGQVKELVGRVQLPCTALELVAQIGEFAGLSRDTAIPAIALPIVGSAPALRIDLRV